MNADGSLSLSDACYGSYGVRPALYLKSDISVSLDGDDESTIEVSEEELYKAAVQKFGERAQILVAIEEMSELTKALLKYIRHEDFNQGDYDDIVESFTREKIPAAFTSEEERRQYVSAFARQYVGQAAHFPETAKEAQHEHPQDEN